MRTVLAIHCVFAAFTTLPALAQQELQTTLSIAQSADPIVVARETQLFINSRLIAHSRHVKLHINSPVKLGVALGPERPWEDKSIGFCARVIEHNGVFKATYQTGISP